MGNPGSGGLRERLSSLLSRLMRKDTHYFFTEPVDTTHVRGGRPSGLG
jgi:hypothetical protein